MRTRQQIREHCIKVFQEEHDMHKRAFKLAMVEIELHLDCRDILQVIADRLPEKPKKDVDSKPAP